MAATTEPATSGQRERRTETSEYVVQVLEAGDIAPGDTRASWVDVATVTVPSRTKRKSVILAGLKKAGLTPEAPIEVRALNAESAQTMSVSVETPEPQLRFS